MKSIKPYTGLILLLLAVGFNLWLYRLEPTAKIDPNDNTFQFALVDRTDTMLDYGMRVCSGIAKPLCVASYLTDHWVPNWAQGYNLPYYYSHVPQIAIVLSWRVLSVFFPLSLFAYYHWVIYVLLCAMPISLFIALSVIGLSPTLAGIGALTSIAISTDGLYGLDPSSFVWRGYGLSSQLFSAFWLPLALAYGYNVLVRHTKQFGAAILFLILTTAGHLGIGIMGFISFGILAVSPFMTAFLKQEWNAQTTKRIIPSIRTLLLLFGGVFLVLGYWIVPVLYDGNYHNISIWDGIWKFDSFGYRPVLSQLFSGNLFDFGRLPALTLLVFIGLLGSLVSEYAPFGFLFVVWLLLYFGRTTWGGLIDLIPGMNEFHLSRFIVGVHAAGLILLPLGIGYMVDTICRYFPGKKNGQSRAMLVYLVLIAIVMAVSLPQTMRYASYNDVLLTQANKNYDRDASDINTLITTIKDQMKVHPGRVFAGRGGSWGKNFKLAETEMFMHLSTNGIPVILWLPETWSPNSDTEQYFSENNPDHYRIYNVRYVATPIDLPESSIQPFWTLIAQGKTWKLYEATAADGYIAGGIRPAIVSTKKTDYRTLVRLWLHTNPPYHWLYPELTFDRAYPKQTGLPNFRMLDEVTYVVPNGSTHNLLAEPPVYIAPKDAATLPGIRDISDDTDMRFRARVSFSNGCNECIAVLRQTYHPSWNATVDGKPAKTFAVFPFYTAVLVNSPGVHQVEFFYAPSLFKKITLFISIATVAAALGYYLYKRIYLHTS